MSLSKPPEPVNIKYRISELYKALEKELGRGAVGLAVWSGSILPRYLWEYWAPVLQRMGYTWPRFLSRLKTHTGLIARWALEGSLTWDDLVDQIIADLTGGERKGLEKYFA
ncbi:MAG: hypothetical protein ABWK01_09925 [Infirmifilum sp.]